jgi:hypothetical protein
MLTVKDSTLLSLSPINRIGSGELRGQSIDPAGVSVKEYSIRGKR